MNVEDEFKVISAIPNMTPDQLREALRFYVGQSFNLLRKNKELSRKNKELSIQLIDRRWNS